MKFSAQYSFCREAEEIARDSLLYDKAVEKKRKSFKEIERMMKEGKAIQQSASLTNSLNVNEIKCPKCGSTQIQLMKRGWKVTTGFLGSSVNERVCLNCKHKF